MSSLLCAVAQNVAWNFYCVNSLLHINTRHLQLHNSFLEHIFTTISLYAQHKLLKHSWTMFLGSDIHLSCRCKQVTLLTVGAKWLSLWVDARPNV